MQEFSVDKTLKPDISQVMNEHDSKKPKDQPVKTENSEDLNRKC
jgi:hypothetical protein